MKMRNVYVISILIIVFIGAGCVGKNIQQNDNGVSPTVATVVEKSTPTAANGTWERPISDLENENVSSENSQAANNGSMENTEDNTSVTNNNTTIGTVSNETTNVTSVTEIFKIGEEKQMLNKNIKLINITDYDNNTVILTIDGVEYKYDSENTSIQVGNIEVIDIITSADDKTAEITTDYIK